MKRFNLSLFLSILALTSSKSYALFTSSSSSFNITIARVSTPFSSNKLSCSTSSKNGLLGCFFNKMKMYDQRSDVADGDMFCGPTSGAMALSALTYGGINSRPGSWTRNKFIGKSKEDRIEAFAELMDSDRETGTTWNGMKKFEKRKFDFYDATGNTATSYNHKISAKRIRRLINRGEVNILSYGHYTKNCARTGAFRICTYDRDGGHVIAVNGYYNVQNGTSVTSHIYDPWKGVEYQRKIEEVSSTSTYLTTGHASVGSTIDYRIYGDNTFKMFSEGSFYAIIDELAGINTN